VYVHLPDTTRQQIVEGNNSVLSDVRHTEIHVHTVEPLIRDPSSFEGEITTEELKRKSSGVFIKFWWNGFK
jgi:hypothetical protein